MNDPNASMTEFSIARDHNVRAPRRGLPIDSKVLRPMMTGFPKVLALKVSGPLEGTRQLIINSNATIGAHGHNRGESNDILLQVQIWNQ